jgi:hypothetical protein
MTATGGKMIESFNAKGGYWRRNECDRRKLAGGMNATGGHWQKE